MGRVFFLSFKTENGFWCKTVAIINKTIPEIINRICVNQIGVILLLTLNKDSANNPEIPHITAAKAAKIVHRLLFDCLSIQLFLTN